MRYRSSTQWFWIVMWATLAIKLCLAWIIPMSGDEAYFIVWAKHPDFGYYDHPPMAGWFLQLMLLFGNSELVLRLPAVLLSSLIGIGIFRLLMPLDEAKAGLAAILFLLAPINVLNVLITTDTPLILFAFFSAAALFKALQNHGMGWYLLSGAFLGMAFLSKYFAALLGLAYFAYFIFSDKSWEKAKGAGALFLAALPFAVVNLYWNYTHCWDNILFNLYNRNESEHFSPDKIVTFLGMQLYLMTPPAIYYLFKHRAKITAGAWNGQYRIFAWAFILPIGILALLSLKRDIGLHWLLAFYPFFHLLLALFFSGDELKKLIKFMLGFSALHLAVVVVIALLPMDTWKQNKLYDGIVFMFKNEEFVEKVQPYEQKGFLLASDGYTSAAIISYHYGKNFFVFGRGSTFARQDDILTDFRKFEDRNILILIKSAPDLEQYEPYFQRVEVITVPVRGIDFYLVLGYGFNYKHYRDVVLKGIKDRHYKIPAILPHAPCYFCEKYFPEEQI